MLVVPRGRRGHGDPPDRDDGRRGRQRRLLHRLRRRRPSRARSATEGSGLDAAHGRAQRRAADPRRADARHRAARVRRPLAYVKERKQFGRPIGSFQALKHRIADLATEIECCRLLTYDVAREGRRQPGRDVPARGVDGQAQGHRDRQAGRARGHADDGRLRLRDRVRHGGPRAHARSSRRSTAARARSSARSSPRRTGSRPDAAGRAIGRGRPVRRQVTTDSSA